jgi:putative ABC transport system permease protein
MLELKNVNKYFNRHHRNEIHVINNTNLSFNNGLIALLGPSGSGKTTILNVVGGLDTVNSGNIYIDGKKINSILSIKRDKLRALNIGYIFQDYKLIDDLSVYDNVSLVLKMIGLKDKKEIEKRVSYVLDKVGMYRFRFRPANMLSGGQKQRVAIARAIVKNPNIILADEPTGNLDSKNSLEVMKIIKAISKDKLVILVTHEENLAKFYADRIVEISDGKVVKDYLNNNQEDLEYAIDNTFYLKDFTNQENLNDNINLYSDTPSDLGLTIVVKNNNIYINSSNHDIQVVDDSSAIEFIDDHYQKIAKSDILKYNFDFLEKINDNFKKRYSSVFSFFKTLGDGFKKVFDFTTIKKFLLGGFFISAMFIVYSFATIAAIYHIKDSDFVTTNKAYLEVKSSNIKVSDYLSYEADSNINYVIPSNSLTHFNLKYKYYQTSQDSDTLTGSLSDIKMITKKDLVAGVMPSNSYEIVVDKLAITKMFSNNKARNAGIIKEKDLLNYEVSVPNMANFKIVGITDREEPNIYVDSSLFINIVANSKYALSDNNYVMDTSSNDVTNTFIDYNLDSTKVELKEGRWPSNDYETIVNIDNKEAMPLNKQINVSINNTKLTVVGYYYSKDSYTYYFVNPNTIKYYVISKAKDITIYAKDKDKVISSFKANNVNISDTYNTSKTNYVLNKQKKSKTSFILATIILVISLIEIYLMIRSSFLSRIREIGIYRAIGVKKRDIYKLFFSEIFAITTLAGVPGIILMSYIIKTLATISYLKTTFYLTPSIILGALIFIYVFNLLIGLIPVFNVIRKTPSEILARYDLD